MFKVEIDFALKMGMRIPCTAAVALDSIAQNILFSIIMPFE